MPSGSLSAGRWIVPWHQYRPLRAPPRAVGRVRPFRPRPGPALVDFVGDVLGKTLLGPGDDARHNWGKTDEILWRTSGFRAALLTFVGRGRTVVISRMNNDPSGSPERAPQGGITGGKEGDEFAGEADGEVAGGSLGSTGTTPGPGVVRPMERASCQPRARPRGVRATSVEPATRGPAASGPRCRVGRRIPVNGS